MEKKIKSKMTLKVGVIYALLITVFATLIFIRYLLLVNDGQAVSIKELNRLSIENRLKNKKIIIINKDSIILDKDSIIIVLEAENAELRQKVQINI